MSDQKIYLLYYKNDKRDEGRKIGGVFSTVEKARGQIPPGLKIVTGKDLGKEEREERVVEKHEFKITENERCYVHHKFCIVELELNATYTKNLGFDAWKILKHLVAEHILAHKIGEKT